MRTVVMVSMWPGGTKDDCVQYVKSLLHSFC